MESRPVVIDTNCLIQMMSKRSPYRPIWDAFLGRRFVLCVSNEILDEYQEIIELHTTAQIAENVILLIMNSSNVNYVDPRFRLQLITSDPDGIRLQVYLLPNPIIGITFAAVLFKI